MIDRRQNSVHYKYKLDEDPGTIRRAFDTQYKQLTNSLAVPEKSKPLVLATLKDHYTHVENLGLQEQQARKCGDKRANLYYHDLNHFWQAGFDGLSIARAIKVSNRPLATHLSPEGGIAIAIATWFHDIGEITASPVMEFAEIEEQYFTDEKFDSLAKHKPIHVYASMDYAQRILRDIPFPKPLDNAKIIELVTQGIHNTLFPWTEEKSQERRAMLTFATPKLWKEAMIVRLAVQLADLGGQSIRVDQIPEGIKRLRAEENEIKPGSGVKNLGTDKQIRNKAIWFTEHMLIPTVGVNANALLGRENVFLANFLDIVGKPDWENLSYSEILRSIPEHRAKPATLKKAA